VSNSAQAITKLLRFSKVDRIDWKLVPLSGVENAWKLPDYSTPLSLCDFVFAHPKPFGESDLNLILTRTALRLVPGTAHREMTGWAPTQFHSGNLTVIAGLRAFKRTA